MFTLRPYQERALTLVRRAYQSGKKSPLLVSPTGSGKTVMFAFVAHHARQKENSVCILVHRRELLRQTSLALREIGLEHGLIQADMTPSYNPIQVASVQTLTRRLNDYSGFDLIIVDEAHHFVKGSMWDKVLSANPKARILGVTATPARLDGKGLYHIFDHLIELTDVTSLVSDGYLSPLQVFAPINSSLDLRGVRKVMGDYDKKEIDIRMGKPKVIGCAVEHYHKYADKKPALVYCPSIKSAQNTAEMFRAAGYNARAIHGNMDYSERDGLISELSTGNLNVLTSCDLISEGIDIPRVEVGILLRPTLSTTLYLQQVGRIMRVYPGKEKGIILDHAGNTLRHGLPSEKREWSLSEGDVAKNKKTDEKIMQVKHCPKCYTVHTPSLSCPNCGWVYEIQSRMIEQEKGELAELTPEIMAARSIKRQQVGKARSMEDLLAIERQRGYRKGWAYFVYNARQRRNK